MAVGIDRIGWIKLFTQLRRPNSFLTRFFEFRPGNAYQGKKVGLDIERYGEDVAVVIKACTGVNMNNFDEYTSKEFTPPKYGEGFALDVCELLDRMAGVDPYTAAYQGYAADLATKAAKGFVLINDKIVRAVELQASQILQTGKLLLIDENGNTVYELDFKPKATHFPTVSVDWDNASSTKEDDLNSLAEVIRADGKVDPDQLIFGTRSKKDFLNDDSIQKLLDNRRINIGEIRPELKDSGATFFGTAWIGDYQFELWSYKDTYKDPQTGNVTKYIGNDKVIMKSSKTRLDITSAKVPLPLGPDPRVANLLPGRMTSTGNGAANNYDVTPNIYAVPSGKEIIGELESRILLLPTQIDGFGCLTTRT